MPYIEINQYDGGLTGHVNVTFKTDSGAALNTYGGNLPWNEPGTSITEYLSSSGVFEESGIQAPARTTSIYVDQASFDSGLSYARLRAAKTDAGNDAYWFIGQNCVDFADSVLHAAGMQNGSILNFLDPESLVWNYEKYMQAAGDLSLTNISSLLNPTNTNGIFNPNNPLNIVSQIMDGRGAPGSGGAESSGAPSWSLHPPPTTPPRDPLVLDVTGGGIHLVSVDDSTAFFDLNADGFRERVGWVEPSAGFLVRDLNGNGAVDNVGELFGGPAEDGFVVLSSLDLNSDGAINSSDASFGSLSVWRDLNQNGTTESGELSSLSSSGVSSISLTVTPSGATSNGNAIGYTGTFTFTAGGTGEALTAYLASDPQISSWIAPSGFTESTASLQMPDLKGYGTVRDLRAEMTLDSELLSAVQAIVSGAGQASAPDMRIAFEGVLYKWTGADSVVAGSRGGDVDARHLAVVEAFYGTQYTLTDRNGNFLSHDPTGPNAANVEKSYKLIFDSLFTKFYSQVAISDTIISNDVAEFDSSPFWTLWGLGYDPEADIYSGDFSSVMGLIKLYAPDGVESLTYYSQTITSLAGARVDFFGQDQAAYVSAVSSEATDLGDAALARFITGIAEGLTLQAGASGSSGADLFIHPENGATLAGGSGDDTYVYMSGAGSVEIQEYAGWHESSNDTLLLPGLAANDVHVSRVGNDLHIDVNGSSSGLVIKDEFASDIGHPAQIENFIFADGSATLTEIKQRIFDELRASGGHDFVGYDSTDTLHGGSGDDSLSGAAGDDRYVYNSGEGADVVTEGYVDGSNDRLVFGAGLNSTNVAFTRSGDALTIGFTGQNGGVTLNNEFGSVDSGVEHIVFGDAVEWSKADLAAAYIASNQTIGNDTVTGFSGAETLQGGAGDDQLSGAGSDDKYIYNPGDGNDTLTEGYVDGSNDTLVFGAGLSKEDLVTYRAGNTVTISFTGETGSITLIDEFGIIDCGVEHFTFADGTTWGKSDLLTAPPAPPPLPQGVTTGDDTVNGDGNENALWGAAGNDDLHGGDGWDTYQFYAGDGSDRIFDAAFEGTNDKLVLGAGLDPSDVVVSLDSARASPTLTFSGGAGSIYLDNQFAGWWAGIERIEFSNGAVWGATEIANKYVQQQFTSGNDSILGLGYNETIQAGVGDDTANGLSGDDTYVYSVGDGSDRIQEDAFNGNSDRLLLGPGITPNMVGMSLSGADVTLTFSGSSSVLYLPGQFAGWGAGVEQIQFNDGTIWSNTNLVGLYIQQQETNGNDTVNALGGDEILQGGEGNDDLYGHEGNDTYIYNIGDGDDRIYDGQWQGGGDRLVLGSGLTSSMAIVDFNGSGGATLRFVGESGSIYIDDAFGPWGAGVNQIIFADNVTWSPTDLVGLYVQQQQTSGNDTVNALGGNETLQGGAGNDDLRGSDGDDTYVYNIGDGDDRIYDGQWQGGGDRLVFGSGLTSSMAIVDFNGSGGATLRFAGENGSIYIDDALGPWGAGVNQIVFADNVTWSPADLLNRYLSGTSGDDTIVGFGNGDIISGGGGDDVLTGQGGADTFVFRAGFGNDRISDFKSNGADQIQFRDSLFSDYNDIFNHAQQIGSDVVIAYDGSNALTLMNAQLSSLTPSDFVIGA